MRPNKPDLWRFDSFNLIILILNPSPMHPRRRLFFNLTGVLMSPHGLGKFTELIPARGRYGSAASRIGKVEADDTPITPEGEFKA
jgi:hypothetical protein